VSLHYGMKIFFYLNDSQLTNLNKPEMIKVFWDVALCHWLNSSQNYSVSSIKQNPLMEFTNPIT